MEILMQFQNKSKEREYLAYLLSLTMLFSYAELLIPRILPFFRLGLANTVVLLSFSLNFPSFTLLLFMKAIASSLLAGTLFSPFALISISQSLASGILMYGLSKIDSKNRFISLYGISMLASAFSALVQIFLSSLYLGEGTKALLGPMILFSIFSGLITAFFAENLNIPKEAPIIEKVESKGKKTISMIKIFLIFLSVTVIFLLKSIPLLITALLLSLVIQVISGRKILILPHLSLWIFVFISSLFTPGGKVLFSVGFITITDEALLLALEKALKLSSVSALSQCAAGIKLQNQGIISMALNYYRGLLDKLRREEGNILKKLKNALSAKNL